MADKIYNESMCATAIQILGSGKSMAALAGACGVCRESIYDWIDKHPEFALAVKKGKAVGQAYWEERGHQAMFGATKNFSASAWIFTMKNRYREDYAEEKENKSVSESLVEKLLDKVIDK